jgi:hypothetical protein
VCTNASAIYFSLIEAAKANGLEPYDNVLHVIANIATADGHGRRL